MTLQQVLQVIAVAAGAYCALDMARTIKRQRQRIHELKQALFDIYHTPEVPFFVRDRALTIVKKGGAQ
ncbi:MAG: hypothetical protein ACK5S6_00535 [bacterium]